VRPAQQSIDSSSHNATHRSKEETAGVIGVGYYLVFFFETSFVDNCLIDATLRTTKVRAKKSIVSVKPFPVKSDNHSFLAR